MSSAGSEIDAGQRFAFGENWGRFLESVDDEHIRIAERSLSTMLGMRDLSGLDFVDVGSGSGLFSLAARNLGARVTSFDYDPASVACTAELRRRYRDGDAEWKVIEGSVLDADFLTGLGEFDIVYSWGVLHHTGDLWSAVANVQQLARSRATMFIAIYNDQGAQSRVWRKIKEWYNTGGSVRRQILVRGSAAYLRTGSTVMRILSPPRRAAEASPAIPRGMDADRDLVDWVGGWPFEVATPEQVFSFLHDRGWQLERLKTCGGRLGCNEFVLVRGTSDR